MDTKWLDINGYHISCDDINGYIAYNSEGKEVYRISPDGIATIRTQNGDEKTFKDLTIYDIKPNIVLEGNNEVYFTFSGDVITKSVCDYGDYGDFRETTYSNDGYIIREYGKSNGDNELLCEYVVNNDGSCKDIDYVRNCTTYYYDDGEKYTDYRTEFSDGTVYYFDDESRLCRIKDPNGNITYFNKNGEKYYMVEREKGTEYHIFDKNNEEYCIEHPDGSKEYICKDDDNFIIYPDGTYVHGKEKGTYIIDESGHIICNDENGNCLFYDKYGQKYQKIGIDGVVYDISKASQAITKDGKVTYSKINHIEYDEESYNKILNTLNGIDGSSVISGCTSIGGAIASFPDSYSSGGISSIKGSIEGHVNLIKSLSEMTNYSLLAYQTCDEELRDGLYLLVDSLFGENELALSDKFKRDIESTVEDRDNDGIIEYKEGTNFKVLSENAIVAMIHTDAEGNKWYLNKNNHVIKIEGKDIKLNYGGETFNLTYDENGVVKLIDSNGKPLNIFGDYNLESDQYGGNQLDLSKSYNNQYVSAIIDKYFPNISQEEKMAILYNSVDCGCGYTGLTNLVFKKYEGNEEEFYKTFGYPMYDIKFNPNDSNLSVDYNYEPLILDLCCHTNPNKYVANGAGEYTIIELEKYLQEEYSVSLDGYTSPMILYGGGGYDLYEMNGKLYYSNGDTHAMLVVGETDDGRQIVSSWGKKYIFDRNDDSLASRYLYSGFDLSYYRQYN